MVSPVTERQPFYPIRIGAGIQSLAGPSAVNVAADASQSLDVFLGDFAPGAGGSDPDVARHAALKPLTVEVDLGQWLAPGEAARGKTTYRR
jgi:hypothetical protein